MVFEILEFNSKSVDQMMASLYNENMVISMSEAQVQRIKAWGILSDRQDIFN